MGLWNMGCILCRLARFDRVGHPLEGKWMKPGRIPSECQLQRYDFVVYLSFWTEVHELARVQQIVAIHQPHILLLGALVTAVPRA